MVDPDTLTQPSTWGGIGHIGISGFMFTLAHQTPNDFTAFGWGGPEWTVILYAVGMLLAVAGALGIILPGFSRAKQRKLDEKAEGQSPS